MSEVKVNKISPRSGTDVTLGDSGDTFTVPTGVTLDTSNSTVTLPDGTVTNAKVNASAAIDYSKLNLTGNIALADLSATGTKDATTFLRGDNTFAEAGGGLVLQAVYGSTNTEITSNVSTFADTGLTATITPSSSSNKVLVIVNQNGLYKQGADIRMQGRLLRGATNLGNFIGDETLRSSNTAAFDMGGTGFSYLDSPSTTSATVYKTQFRNVDNTNTVAVQNGSSVSSITLLEISA